MTNLEILNLAMNGLCTMINKEEEINERTKKENGHENSISIARLEIYNKQYDELRELILKEEKVEVNNMGKVKNVIKGHCSREDYEALTIISDEAIEYSGSLKRYLKPIELMKEFKKSLDDREVKRVETTLSGKLVIFI